MYCGLEDLSRTRMKRWAYAAAAVLMVLALALWTGCGDVFRPVANPIPGPTTDPRNFHIAIVVSQNAVGNPGSGMQIDVSGDSNVGVVNTGQQPLYAALLPQSDRVFVSNSDGTVTSFAPAGTTGSIGVPSTISLPAGLVPGFLFSTEIGTMYAATTGTNATCSAPTPGVVAAINSSSLVVDNIICVGSNPKVLTETPDSRKVYSVNSDGTVSSINTVDKSVNPPVTAPSLTAPVSAVASVDGSEVFVLDATGVVWIINTFTDQVTVPSNQAASPANSLALDRTRNRLYVTGTGSGSTPSTLRILDASSPTLSPVTAAPLTLPAGATPVMTVFLPDGTRAYVLSSTTANSPVVTVINTANNAIVSTINLPSATANPAAVTACQSPLVHPFSMTTAGNSSRLYVANCFAANTSIIDASTNTLVVTMNSPTSAYPVVAGTAFPPPQNPVFVVAGP